MLAIGVVLMALTVGVVMIRQGERQPSILGENFSFPQTFRGRAVRLDVMNTEGQPCRVETPELRQLHDNSNERFGDHATIVSVTIEWPLFGEPTEERPQAFAREFEVR